HLRRADRMAARHGDRRARDAAAGRRGDPDAEVVRARTRRDGEVMDTQNSVVIPDAPKARSGTHFSLDRSIDGRGYMGPGSRGARHRAALRGPVGSTGMTAGLGEPWPKSL